MRQTTRYRYYARNGVCVNLREAMAQLEEAARQAGKVKNRKRLAKQILGLSLTVKVLLDLALAIPVTLEERALAEINRRAQQARNETQEVQPKKRKTVVPKRKPPAKGRG